MTFSKTATSAVCLMATFGLSAHAMAEPESIVVENGASLTIDELRDADVSIESGGLLTGTAGVTGNIINAGRIAPGAGVSDFVIFGDFSQSSTGLLDIDVAAGGLSDSLLVLGTADIGGTVNLNPLSGNGAFTVGSTQTIVSSDLGITSSVSQLTVSNDLLSRALIRPSIAVVDSDLVLTFDPLSFVSSDLTPNQLAIANALDASLGQSTGDLTEFTVDLGLVSLSEAAGPIEQLVPETAAVLSSASIRSSQLFHTMLDSQIARGAAAGDGWSGWAGGFGGFGENTNSRNQRASEFDYDIYGLAIGADRAIGDFGRFGFAIGISKADLELDGRAKQGEQQAIQGSLYASYRKDNVRFSGAFSVGYIDLETEQSLAAAAGAPIATGDFDGYVFAGSTEAAYVTQVDKWQVEGFAGLDVHSAHQGSYTETGAGSIGFDIDSKTETSFRSRVGGRVKLGDTTGKTSFQPEIKAAWVHEFSYDDNGITGQFAGLNNTRFAIEGARPAEDFAEIEAGFTASVGDGSWLYASYTGLIGSGETVHGITAGYRFRW